MNPSDDLKRILRAAGEPPALDLRGLQRDVWSRLDRPTRPGSTLRWWRGWMTAGVFAGAVTIGLLSAAWRVERVTARSGDGDARTRYLQLIDPRVRPMLPQAS
jgi:hypothetical protein